MKFRNHLLALACIFGFAAAGYLYVRTWVVQRPFGIILFVSDGMVARQLTAARLYEGGADHQLAVESFPNVALLRNSALDFAVPDDASAATALATGQRVNHRTLSVDSEGRPLPTITELARAKGRAIGIVTTGSLTSPTAAAFYAHVPDCRDPAALALTLLGPERPELILGGGANDFLGPTRGGKRKDGRDLLAELEASGCQVVRNKADLKSLEAYHEKGVVGVFAHGSLPFANQIESGSQPPSLEDMVSQAIVFLESNRKGYILIVDASLPGVAAERNEGERTLMETIALDHAIDVASRYAGKHSLILAVGRHSTGGMSLNGFPLRQDRGAALLGMNAGGYPSLTWATGPNGPTLPGAPAVPLTAAQTANARNEPAAFQTSAGLNTAEDMVAAGKGVGSEKLHGFVDSTAIFDLLKEAL